MKTKKFRWCYRSEKGQWYDWVTTELVDDEIRILNLLTTSHAGDLKFQIEFGEYDTYTAVIRWSNPDSHSLKSIDNFVNNKVASQVSLNVDYPFQVANPETFYLLVERIA